MWCSTSCKLGQSFKWLGYTLHHSSWKNCHIIHVSNIIFWSRCFNATWRIFLYCLVICSKLYWHVISCLLLWVTPFLACNHTCNVRWSIICCIWWSPAPIRFPLFPTRLLGCKDVFAFSLSDDCANSGKDSENPDTQPLIKNLLTSTIAVMKVQRWTHHNYW